MAQKAPNDAKPPRDVGVVGAIAGRLLWLALPTAACTAVYLIYNFYVSRLGLLPMAPEGGRLTAEQQTHIAQTIHVTSLVLTIAGSLATLFVMLRYYDSDAAVFGVAAAGAVAYLGVPMLIKHQLATIGRPHNDVTLELTWAFLAFGKVALVVAGARVVAGLVLRLVRRPRRVRMEMARSGKGVAARPGMLSPCWELSKCGDFLRDGCPNFKDRKTCWRVKNGCGCNPQFARRAVDGKHGKQDYLEAVYAIEARAQESAAAADEGERRALMRQAQGMCRECAIYLEHQEYKYRTLQWFTYPLAAVLIWRLFPWIDRAYRWGLERTDDLVAGLRLLPQPERETIANQILGIDVEWLVIFTLGILLVTWLLRLLERWVFEWKW